MYKVFFKDRTVLLSDESKESFRKSADISYKYESKKQLSELLNEYYSSGKIQSIIIFHTDIEFLWKEFVSCYKFIHAAGGLVFNSKGKFLIIKRNGIWDLPKGKAEEGETSGETALREVSEECGLNSLVLKNSLTKTYHTYFIRNTPVLKETEWFEMNTNGSEKTTPQIKEDITEIKWIKKSDAGVILDNTYPSVIDVLRKAGIFKYPPSPA